VPCSGRTERLPVRQVDHKPDIIREGRPAAYRPLMVIQPSINAACRTARHSSCRRHADDLPVDQLGLALYLVQIFYCGAGLGAHRNRLFMEGLSTVPLTSQASPEPLQRSSLLSYATQ